jgi:hypothetical protein
MASIASRGSAVALPGARNRNTDLLRKKRSEAVGNEAVATSEDVVRCLDHEPPSPGVRSTRMNFGPVLEIEDLGNHHPAAVIQLGILLAGAVDVVADPKRKGVYEVEGGSAVYYIYVSPVSETISLLACWTNVARSVPQLDVADAVQSRTPEVCATRPPRRYLQT